MSIKQRILSIMREWAPESLAESWDNVGLQLDTERHISRVALVLELNLDTWDILLSHDYDFIVSHHPLIFSPIRSLTHTEWTHGVIRELIKRDVGLYVSHTNLDAVDTGVSHALMSQYSLSPESVSDLSNGYGKVLRFTDPIDLSLIESAVPAMAKIIPSDLVIKSVAFLGGSGKGFISNVIDQDIDVYVTGELGYHDIQYLREQKKGVVLLGHYQSEVFVLDDIQRRLSDLDIDIDIIR